MRRITKILTASILAVSLFSSSVLSAFPAVAVEKTYTTKDLFSKILPDNATITISDLDDLNRLDTYIQIGMLNKDSNYTFRLENDIALSDYTFDRQNDSSKITIYENQSLPPYMMKPPKPSIPMIPCRPSVIFLFKASPGSPVAPGHSVLPLMVTVIRSPVCGAFRTQIPNRLHGGSLPVCPVQGFQI